MGKFQDLTGKTFGDWTVLKLSEKRTGGRVHWDCECGACGKIVGVSAHNLTRGTSNNCGCVADKVASKRYCINEIGNTYGELTVIQRDGVDENLRAMWRVRCSCGKEFVISGKRLRRNKEKHACYECAHKIIGIKNRIDISGNKYHLLTAVKIADENDCRKWLFKCECGGEIICNRSSVLRGLTKSCGCMVSSGEAKLRHIFLENNIDFVPQKTFDGCVYKRKLKFDFYIPSFNLCIELDGGQHDEPVNFFGGEKSFEQLQIRDNIKDDFCAKNNIYLLRIKYQDYNRIEEILRENKII